MRALGKVAEITHRSPGGVSIYKITNMDLWWQIALEMIPCLGLDSATER